MNTGHGNIFLKSGQQDVTYSNVSNNICNGYSSYVLIYSYGKYGISYSSIRNNRNLDFYLTFHSYSGSSNDQCMIKSCNFIGNPQCANAVLYFQQSAAAVDSCSILNNVAVNTFFVDAIDKTVTVSNCYSDSESKTGGILNIQNPIKDKSIVPLSQKSLGNCIFVVINNQNVQCQCTIIQYNIYFNFLNSRTIYILLLLK